MTNISPPPYFYEAKVLSTDVKDLAMEFGCSGDKEAEFEEVNDFVFITVDVPISIKDTLKENVPVTPDLVHLSSGSELYSGVDVVGYPGVMSKQVFHTNQLGLPSNTSYNNIKLAFFGFMKRSVMHGEACILPPGRNTVTAGYHYASCPKGVTGGPCFIRKGIKSSSRARFIGITYGGASPPSSTTTKWVAQTTLFQLHHTYLL
jgi:hypothetical protein